MGVTMTKERLDGSLCSEDLVEICDIAADMGAGISVLIVHQGQGEIVRHSLGKLWRISIEELKQ